MRRNLHLSGEKGCTRVDGHSAETLGVGECQTTLMECTLLATTAFVLPFDDHLPTIKGYSSAFLVFGLLGSYSIVVRSSSLVRVLLHPLFLVAGFSLFVCAVIEALHINSSYSTIARMAMMYAGGVVIASLCRDRKALQCALCGLVAGSSWLSTLLLSSSYTAVVSASASDYRTAGIVRGKVFDTVTVAGDLNALAFYAAIGAAVALAMALTSRRLLSSVMLFLAAVLCATGAFIPMSRGAIVILLTSVIIVLRSRGAFRLSTVLGVLGFAIVVLAIAPDAVFSRMKSTEGGRFEVYSAASESVFGVASVGVGEGNYERWAVSHGLRSRFGSALGVHNGFLQTLVYWGILGLASLLLVVLLAARYFPKTWSNDGLRAGVRILTVALVLYAMVAHTTYDKQFSLGLGLLVATDRWIWPNG